MKLSTSGVIALCVTGCVVVFCLGGVSLGQDDPQPKKPKQVPLFKKRMTELEQLFKTAQKEYSAQQSSVDREDAANKHTEAILEWAKEVEGDRWTFEATVRDLVRDERTGNVTLIAELPIISLPLRGPEKPLTIAQSLELPIDDELRDRFIVGTKISIDGEVEVRIQDGDLRDFYVIEPRRAMFQNQRQLIPGTVLDIFVGEHYWLKQSRFSGDIRAVVQMGLTDLVIEPKVKSQNKPPKQSPAKANQDQTEPNNPDTGK